MARSASAKHTPLVLELEDKYGLTIMQDERSFLFPLPKNGDPSYFQKRFIQRVQTNASPYLINDPSYLDIVKQLIVSLGRVPSFVEVETELYRSQIFDQIYNDRDDQVYLKTEVLPKRELAKQRREDFPESNMSKKLFAEAPIKIEKVNGIERLILCVPNSRGETVDHPVMTNEEIKWVDLSAKTITNVLSKNPSSEIFIAGLGLALLNISLVKCGVLPSRQIVAEINKDVIRVVTERFNKYVRESIPEIPEKEALQILEGDFIEIIDKLINSKKKFAAVSIDVFPNTSDQINCDSSNEKVLAKSLKILEPGGLLTFYADSRYLPYDLLIALNKHGIPNSSINYTVAKINTSEFTQQYHYGDLLSVIHVQKPLLENLSRVDDLLVQYQSNLKKITKDTKKLSMRDLRSFKPSFE